MNDRRAGASRNSLRRDSKHLASQRRSPARRSKRLAFEKLEDRQLLATTQAFDGVGTAFNLYQNANAPAPLVVAGGPTGSFLRLASATTNTPIANVLSFPRTDAGAFGQVVAEFDFRITPGEQLGAFGRADGFGFALLKTANWGIIAANAGGGSEEPNFAGSLGIGFDVYQNDDLADIGNDIVRANYSNSISVHFNGLVVQQFDVSPVVDLASGQWIHARIVIRAAAGFGDVSVALTPAGGRATTVVDRLPVTGLAPYEGRAHFGARAGGESAHHDIDNVVVQHSNFPSLAAGMIEFGSASVSATENQGTTTLSVVRRAGSTGQVTVGYATLDDSATAGVDYSAVTGTVTFAAGELGPKTVTIPLLDDDDVEGTERFQLRLLNPTGGALLGVAGEASVLIQDNEGTVQNFDSAAGSTYTAVQHAGDPAATVLNGGPTGVGKFFRLASVPNAGEANHNSIAFNATLTTPPTIVVADFDLRMRPVVGRADGLGFALLNTATYGTSGGVPPQGPLFSAEEPNFVGSLGLGFDLFNSNKAGPPHPDDDINELDIHNIVSLHFNGVLLEQFDATPIVDLANGQWIHTRLTVEPALTPGASLVTVELTPCSGCPAQKVIDRYPVAGLVPYAGRAWFGARSGGLASQHDIDNVNIKALSPTESLIALSSASYSALEGGSLNITVQRTANVAAPASVQYATEDGVALAGIDYLPINGTLQFAAGEISKTLSVAILNDSQTEANPYFKLKLQEPTSGSFLGGPFEATVNIVDDESAATQGSWSPVIGTSIVAIHAHLLPSGQVIYWDRLGEVRLFDPVTMTVSNPGNPDANLFCAGETFLPSGELLVAGGHHHGGSPEDDGMGLDTALLYDYRTNTWNTGLPLMNDGRWYPTTTILGNGDVLVISGSSDHVNEQYIKNTLPQVLQTGTLTWRDLTVAGAQQLAAPVGAAPLGGDLYPRMFQLPDGRVFKAGPDKLTWFLNTAGQGNWTPGPPTIFGFRGYGAAVMYAPGKIMILGGGQAGNPNEALHATATVEVIDFNLPNPVWRTVAPMAFARRQLNATLLPTGKVLVTGGVGGPGFNNELNAVMPAEVWDPATETWTTLPAMSVVRGYHATALLVPDGRVLIGGGGQGANALSFENNAQFYSPSYLFQGSRPTILSAPAAATYGQALQLQVTAPTSIKEVTMLPLASVTHAFDFNNRFVSLGMPQIQAGKLVVNLPTNPNVLPPGPWMLFTISDQGVPSIGSMIQITDPHAANDRFVVDENVATTLEIDANDVIRAGQPLVVSIVTPPAHGTLVLNADGSQTYTPTNNYVGADVFTYQVADPAGHLSNVATVEIEVCSKDWTNPANSLDINNDGKVTAFDALAIINHINIVGVQILPAVTPGNGPPPYLDATCDGRVSAFDALVVINYLNTKGVLAKESVHLVSETTKQALGPSLDLADETLLVLSDVRERDLRSGSR